MQRHFADYSRRKVGRGGQGGVGEAKSGLDLRERSMSPVTASKCFMQGDGIDQTAYELCNKIILENGVRGEGKMKRKDAS